MTLISRAWGGRVSDKKLTEASGILNNLFPGDVVLADCGFSIDESVGLFCVSLKIPTFIRGKPSYQHMKWKKQEKLLMSKYMLIGLVHQKYQILQSGALPTEYMYKKAGESHSVIDKIEVICCALTNLS